MGLLPCNIGDITIQVPLIRMIPLKSEAKIDPKHPKKSLPSRSSPYIPQPVQRIYGRIWHDHTIRPFLSHVESFPQSLRKAASTTSPIHQESSPAESILESQPPWSLYNPLISPYLLGGVALRVGGGGYRHNQRHANDSYDGFKLIFFQEVRLAAKIDPCWWSDAFKSLMNFDGSFSKALASSKSTLTFSCQGGVLSKTSYQPKATPSWHMACDAYMLLHCSQGDPGTFCPPW